MAIHQFGPSLYHRTIGSHEPVLWVADGDTIITSALDAGGFDENDEQMTA